MPILLVELSSKEEAALAALAKLQGISVELLLQQLILRSIRLGPGDSLQPDLPLTAEEFEAAFDEIVDMIPDNLPPLSDKALSRESFYDGRG